MARRSVMVVCSSIVMVMSLGGGLQASAISPAAATPSAIQWGACPPPPDGIPDAGQQCATLSVPLDYTHPNGQKISVSISRVLAANPAQRRGVLFMNPGGP